LKTLLITILVLCSCTTIKKKVDNISIFGRDEDRSIKREKKKYRQAAVYVSSYSDPSKKISTDKNFKLNLLTSPSKDLRYKSDNWDILNRCKETLEYKFNWKVTISDRLCDDCVNASVAHYFKSKEYDGGVEESCSGQVWSSISMATTRCSKRRTSYVLNTRALTFFLIPGNSDKHSHEIEASSVGSVNSVIKISDELCYAAFKDFPERLDSKLYKVTAIKFYEKK
jgi:hypothetical protein